MACLSYQAQCCRGFFLKWVVALGHFSLNRSEYGWLKHWALLQGKDLACLSRDGSSNLDLETGPKIFGATGWLFSKKERLLRVILESHIPDPLKRKGIYHGDLLCNPTAVTLLPQTLHHKFYVTFNPPFTSATPLTH